MDCKVESDQEIVKVAPKINDFLSEAAKERFDAVLATLDRFGIPYVIEENLVRGLDYYSETVFEYTYTAKVV